MSGTKEDYDKIACWIALLGLWVSIIGIGTAVNDYFGSRREAHATLEASSRQSEVTLYIELKTNFERILIEAPSNLGPEYKLDPKNTKDLRYFQDYWQQSFDEWFATTQLLEPKESHLWNDYYKSAISDALTKQYYVDSLCILVTQQSTWRHKSAEFLKALQDMYSNKNEAPGCLATI